MNRKLEGKIVSDKMNKTKVVEIVRLKKHPRYKKYFKVSIRIKAHDEQNAYKSGDKVLIEQTKPISKEKHWKIINKI